MQYLENSEALVGYKVRVEARPAFWIVGYTMIVQPGEEDAVPRFARELMDDGRLVKLKATAPGPVWELGLGSWDAECPNLGYRYTVCIEETPGPALDALAREYPLFRKEIGASEWMCFEINEQSGKDFWKDDPYKMMKVLGYRFYANSPSVGLHFDAFPPDYDQERNPIMEFWITVAKRRGGMNSV